MIKSSVSFLPGWWWWWGGSPVGKMHVSLAFTRRPSVQVYSRPNTRTHARTHNNNNNKQTRKKKEKKKKKKTLELQWFLDTDLMCIELTTYLALVMTTKYSGNIYSRDTRVSFHDLTEMVIIGDTMLLSDYIARWQQSMNNWNVER